MRQDETGWMRSERCGESGHCVEMLEEGDGNFLVRSSFNRDRQLRLTAVELDQICDMWASGAMVPAPAKVS